MLAFWRIIKFSFQDIGRNFGLAVMTVFILVLMLLSVNTLWSVRVTTKAAVALVKDQINVSVYFNPDAKEKDVTEIKKYLASFPEVTRVDQLSPEEVLASFRDRHQLSPEVLEGLQELGGNPFGSTLIVKTREPSDYVKIIKMLEVPEYKPLIEAKSFDEHADAIDRLQNITTRVEGAALGLAVLFAIISFLVIFNTIRVAIQSQWMEIGIKRLVGASNWFIRGPYLIESFVFTIASVGISFIIIYFATRWIDSYLGVIFDASLSLTNYYNSHILYLLGVQILAVLILTVVSSSLAMRRQLKI